MKSPRGEWNIHVMSPDGGHRRRVTSGKGDKTDPCFSPDGRWIVFSADFGEKYASLYACPFSGGAPVRVTSSPDCYDGAPCWSPDGRFVLFESSKGEPEGSPGTALWKIRVPRSLNP